MPKSSSSFASIYLPVPKYQAYTYRIAEISPSPQPSLPRGEGVKPGQLVLVPFGRRKAVGLVATILDKKPSDLSPHQEIKEVLEILPEECSLSPQLLKLFEWAKSHYLTPPGEVLRAFFPSSILKGKLNEAPRAKSPFPLEGFLENTVVSLNPNQKKVITVVQSHLKTFYPALLQGVTGSGKTEVYLQLCEEALSRGLGTLVLVPEIALTPQMVGRFAGRFGEEVGVYHSGLTEAQRLKLWWSVRKNRQKIIVGTRSSIFLPVKDLAVIIVDEEHDASYKQEERFRYHARDLAVMRAKLEQIPIVLGSATPSMESLENVQNKKYHLFKLPERATQKGALPKLCLVDLKKDRPHPETFLSEALRKELHHTLEQKEQALLFLNRRGFSPFILCQDCGQVFRCPNCEISLTYHLKKNVLKCHYCEYYISTWNTCLDCQSQNLKSMGVGTEQIETSLSQEFPHARIGRLDRDVVSSRLKTEQILSQFATGDLDILIGTQMVVKGHDFRRLTLVGILLADLTLNQPDFRAAERVFQVVTQVGGRAGRHDLPGQVFLQTFRPEHFAITAAKNSDGANFFVQEQAYRKEVGYPPFSRIVLLRLSGTHAKRVETSCRTLSQNLKSLFRQFKTVKILGPAKAALEKLRGKYRWQIILRSTSFESMRRVLEEKIPHLEKQLETGVQLQIDVDPVGSF